MENYLVQKTGLDASMIKQQIGQSRCAELNAIISIQNNSLEGQQLDFSNGKVSCYLLDILYFYFTFYGLCLGLCPSQEPLHQ